jgi:hypothetical protein
MEEGERRVPGANGGGSGGSEARKMCLGEFFGVESFQPRVYEVILPVVRTLDGKWGNMG